MAKAYRLIPGKDAIDGACETNRRKGRSRPAAAGRQAMKRYGLALATLCALVSCSPDTSQKQKATKAVHEGPFAPEPFVGQPFSKLAAERGEFLVRGRAVSREALGAYSEADGTELPGEIRVLKGRKTLLFFTCRKDRCSQASNIILVDPQNGAMHLVSWSEQGQTVVIDGPPEMARFAREHCRGTSCDETKDIPAAKAIAPAAPESLSPSPSAPSPSASPSAPPPPQKTLP